MNSKIVNRVDSGFGKLENYKKNEYFIILWKIIAMKSPPFFR